MRGKTWIVCAVLAFLLAVSTASFGICGLVVTDSDGTTTLVSNGKLKSISMDSMESQMVLDLERETITVIDQSKKTASHGTIDEYCAAMQKMSQVMAQRMQEMRDQTMSDMPKSMTESQSSIQQVTVEHVGSGGNIAGYATDKYEVYVDGELYEEVWASKDQDFFRELGDISPMIRFFSCVSRMTGTHSVESNSDYQSMLQSGWMLKSIEHGDGYPEVMVDVRQIEKKSIPDSEFEIPAGYKKMPLGDLFSMR